jgi:hypothetical protein
MNPEADQSTTAAPAPDSTLPRLFVREPGWHVMRKIGSDREFCFTISPGRDSYHRLSDGELYLAKGDEKLCVPCASRRGLITFEPKLLRDSFVPLTIDGQDDLPDYDIGL